MAEVYCKLVESFYNVNPWLLTKKAKFVGKNILIASSFLYANTAKIKEVSIPADSESNPGI